MKKKNLFLKSTSSLLAMLFVVMSAFMITSCGEDPEPEPENNIVETLTDLGGYDSLIKYVSVYPDLVSTLNSASEKTLFAPNNAAFASLLETPGFPQDITTINPGIIKAVLTYHVVVGQEIAAADLSGELTTAYNDEVIIVNNGTLETGATNPEITLGDTDIKTTTGIIHETNSVLIPPSIGAQLTPILGTVSGTLLLGADFSDLAIAIQRVDAARAERGDTPFAQILADRQGSYTVFAPVNAVFDGAGIDPSTADVGFLEAVILNHVIVGDNLAAADIQGQLAGGDNTLTTLGGEVTVAPTEFQGNPTLSIGGAAVVSPDNVTGNGTVHAIAGFVSSNSNSYSAVLLGSQGSSSPSFYNVIANATSGYGASRDASASIDFAYYYGATNEVSLGAIDSEDLNSVFSSVDLPIADIFETRNATRFQVTSLSAAEFDGIVTNAQVAGVANSELTSNPDATNLEEGSVIAFKLDDARGGLFGLVKVAEVNDTNGTGSITIDVKVIADAF
ncbi:fasciclin domain-containing protein [Marivirga salinae]|uniref:Fasciclin domain-containing protein n=1 Tax=Marivirga salinarum TaxID=3059078 RepID=A0AA49GBQ2_9BACT|nr:fasciclin domain-containing protein [Marivirga sp. BDSF4-3]WKK75791.2 fasciclin domain-containing protein [Marivirga sp. BDSF4-3]